MVPSAARAALMQSRAPSGEPPVGGMATPADSVSFDRGLRGRGIFVPVRRRSTPLAALAASTLLLS